MIYLIAPISVTLAVATSSCRRGKGFDLKFFDEVFSALCASAITSFTIWVFQ